MVLILLINRKKKITQTKMEDHRTVCTCNPNIYQELRAREIEYVQLIRDLYQENQKLKGEIASLKEEVVTSTMRVNQAGSNELGLSQLKSISNECSYQNVTMNQIHEVTTNNNHLTIEQGRKKHERTPSFNAPTNTSTENITGSDSVRNHPCGSLYSFIDNREGVRSLPQPCSTYRNNSIMEQKPIIEIPAETKFNKFFSNLLKSEPNIEMEGLFPQSTTEIELGDSHMQNSSKTQKQYPWNIKTNKSIVVRDDSKTSVKHDGCAGDDGISEYSQLSEFRYGANLKTLINRNSQMDIKQPNLISTHLHNPLTNRVKETDHHKQNKKHVSFSPVPSNAINYTARLAQTNQKNTLMHSQSKRLLNHEQTLAKNRQIISNKVYL